MAFHKQNSLTESKLLERKKQEEAADNMRIEKEELARKNVVKKMVLHSDSSLSPITNALSHFEGKYR